MSLDRILQLKLIADVSDINSGLKKTEGRMKRFGQSAAKWGKALTAGLVLEGINVVRDSLVQGIEDFRDGEDAARNLGMTWDRLGQDGERFAGILADISDNAVNMGFDDTASVKAYDKFLQMTRDSSKAMKLLAASQDLARAEGISLEQAQARVTSLFNGSARATRLYGVEGKKGMAAVNGAMKTNKKKAEEWANNHPLEVFQGKLSEGMEALAGELVPFIDEAAKFANENIGPALDKVAIGWDAIVTAFNKLPPSAAAAVAGLAAAFGALAVAIWANPAVLAVGGFVAAVAGLGTLITMWDDMDTPARVAAGGIAVLTAAFAALAVALWANPIVLIVAGIVVAGLALAVAAVWIGQNIDFIGEKVSEFAHWIGSYLPDIDWASIGNIVLQGVKLIFGPALVPIAALAGAVDALITLFNGGSLEDAIGKFLGWVGGVVPDIDWSGLIPDIDWNGAGKKVQEGLQDLLDLAVEAVRNGINLLIGAWNSLDFSIDIDEFVIAEGWKNVPLVPDLPRITVGPMHSGDLVPDIPYLAKGGIVNKPTLAMIGEAGAEAVVPLDGKHGMGNTIVVNFNGVVGDPAEAGRKVVDVIKRYESRAGRSWRTA